MKNRMGTYIASASALMLGLSACGGDGSAAGETDGDSLTEITVGVIPIASNAPIYLGDAEGFFEEEGLSLEIRDTVGGAAAIPAVQSGDFDFADSNLVSIMVAKDRGLDLTIVATGSASTGDSDEDATAVVVPEDSSIQSPADLAGSTVSVNTLENIGDTTISAVVEADGGDPSSIEYMEVPFPDVPAALSNNQVDAAWVAEPFLTQVLSEGARVVTYNYADFHPNTHIEGYFATNQTVEDEPDVVERFQNAMNRSHEYAEENPQAVRDIIGEYTNISAEVREEITLNSYPTTFDTEALQELGEAAVRYGTMSEVPNLDDLLHDRTLSAE